MRSTQPRGAGQSARIPDWSISASSTRAATSRRGSNRRCSSARCARGSDRSARNHHSRKNHSPPTRGVTMASTQMSIEREIPNAAHVDMKLEVIVLPVSDVERAKRFYQGLGWRLDADFPEGDDFRVVQLTPPGSPCSIHFGKGVTKAAPGSVQNLYLVVSDIDAARAELIAHGANVSEIFHNGGLRGPRLPGRDPERRSYRTFATFSDPDGNGWLLQEINERLPGRGLSIDVASLTELLREAEKHHGEYEPTAAKHRWWGWYAPYVVAREQGKTREEAARDGARRIESPRQ